MKYLLIALSTLLTAQVHASYYATHCSNPSASIKWESGHNSNSITIRYYEDVAKEKKLSLNKVEIKEGKQLVIKDESVCRGGMFSKTKVYATTVSITPALDFPDALDFYGESPIKVEVICQHHMNGRSACQ